MKLLMHQTAVAGFRLYTFLGFSRIMKDFLDLNTPHQVGRGGDITETLGKEKGRMTKSILRIQCHSNDLWKVTLPGFTSLIAIS